MRFKCPLSLFDAALLTHFSASRASFQKVPFSLSMLVNGSSSSSGAVVLNPKCLSWLKIKSCCSLLKSSVPQRKGILFTLGNLLWLTPYQSLCSTGKFGCSNGCKKIGTLFAVMVNKERWEIEKCVRIRQQLKHTDKKIPNSVCPNSAAIAALATKIDQVRCCFIRIRCVRIRPELQTLTKKNIYPKCVRIRKAIETH